MFEPREGTELAALQEADMEKLQEEGQVEEVEEMEDKEDNQMKEAESQQGSPNMPDGEEDKDKDKPWEGDAISLGIAQRVSARQ